MSVNQPYNLLLSVDGLSIEILPSFFHPDYPIQSPPPTTKEIARLQKAAASCRSLEKVWKFLIDMRGSPLRNQLYFYHINVPLHKNHEGVRGSFYHKCFLDAQINFVTEQIFNQKHKSCCVVL